MKLVASSPLSVTVFINILQDILFGRGGLTNRHHGNKKYRSVINQFRQEYVDAKKTDKPRVARRVVKKILADSAAEHPDSPVRFLKRDEEGGWVEVDESEAAVKVSQALREKTRWSCMKEREKKSPVVKLEVEKKRKVEVGAEAPAVLRIETALATGETKVKKIKLEASPPTRMLTEKPPQLKLVPILKGIPNASEIVIPPLPSADPSHVSLQGASGGIHPTDSDVLFGRGGRTNHHPGNKRLRSIVETYKCAYEGARKADKPKYSKAIVQALREAEVPSRFLRMNETTGEWEDVGDRRASEKVSQTLREKEREEKGNGVATKPAGVYGVAKSPALNIMPRMANDNAVDGVLI